MEVSDETLCGLSALEMRDLLLAGELSARELLSAHLLQIEKLNPELNAIVTLVPERAEELAALADQAFAEGRTLGVLHGLPVAHKDLVDTAGVLTTLGSPIYKDRVPESDDLIVERMRNAGAIMIGKTNTPEFGAGSQTFNEVFGVTSNPFTKSEKVRSSAETESVSALSLMDGATIDENVGTPLDSSQPPMSHSLIERFRL